MFPLLRLAAVALVVFGSAAAAQPTDIDVKPTAAYKHKSTGIVLPSELGGLKRSRVAAFAPGDLDVMARYGPEDQSQITTVYLFRNVSGNVPVWFDRAMTMVQEHNRVYGELTPVVRAQAFVPPKQSTWSGLKTVYAADGTPFVSTAVAVAPVGEFYLKLRMSSATLTPAQLDARLKEVLKSIRWPRRIAAAPAAVPVTDCAAPMVFSGEAKPVEADLNMALVGGLLAASESLLERKVAPNAPPPRWCREPAKMEAVGVYRVEDSSDSYLIAFQDAGRAISVGRNNLGMAVAKSDTPHFSVKLIMLDEELGYGDYDILPPPQQAMRLVNETEAHYAVSTFSGAKRIGLNENLFGN